MTMNINIMDEQKKAQEHIKEQGLRVLVCAGTGCVANGSLKVIEKFRELGANVSTLTDYDKMTIVPTGCHGFCEQGVLVIIPDKHVTYVKVHVEDVEEIFESHVKNNQPVERLLYKDPKTGEAVHKNDDINFYAKQTRTALKNCGKINAESIEEAISVRGYEALAKVIEENNPDGVIDTITKSGLRGRGGGGFPTGMKWKFTAANKGGKSYVVCNGDEGDPGAFMDRSVMEGDPHKLLEGMAIAGFAIGADEAYIYVRAEYPLAIIPKSVLLPTPEPANKPIRCPQPNVIQASIARTPVENISVIIGLSNGPGGGPSIVLQIAPVVSIGLPSIGSPIGFTNLPSKKSPTGIVIGLPVVVTRLPWPIPVPSYKSNSCATSPLKATTSAGFFHL
ncbi:MAG: NAD(P)H-dependent oxidoreductase subunit E [bacterium]|nr:NAD(P)H-dependent oxidoreductase subunit E [bacterium]